MAALMDGLDADGGFGRRGGPVWLVRHGMAESELGHATGRGLTGSPPG